MKTFETLVFEFKEAMKGSLDEFSKAGALYVTALDTYPKRDRDFRASVSGFVPEGKWKQLEAIGRGKLHPKLFFGGFHSAAKAAAVGRAPLDVQHAALAGQRFKFVYPDLTTHEVTVDKAPEISVTNAFVSTGLRTPAVQTRFMKEKPCASKTVSASYRFFEKKTRVKFSASVRFTKPQLQAIVDQMA